MIDLDGTGKSAPGTNATAGTSMLLAVRAAVIQSPLVCRTGLGRIKATERFPLTEHGWTRAWQALVSQNPAAAPGPGHGESPAG